MEKGSMLTAIEHGSVGPKRMAKAISESKAVYCKTKYKNRFMNEEFTKFSGIQLF